MAKQGLSREKTSLSVFSVPELKPGRNYGGLVTHHLREAREKDGAPGIRRLKVGSQ